MNAPAPAAGNGVPIPDLTFTVAISGQRDILPDRGEAVHAAIAKILTACRKQLKAGIAASPLDSGRRLTTRFLTALACGADQIGAEAALSRRDWLLDIVLPYQKQAYLGSLRDNLPEAVPDHSATLLDRASSVLELADWAPAQGKDDAVDGYWRDRRFRTVGQLLVQRADLLIAIWRGKPPAGPGGTATVMGEAHRVGVPILWIDPDTGKCKAIPRNPQIAHENILKVAQSAETGAKAVNALLAAAIGPTLAQEPPSKTAVAQEPPSRPARAVASLAAFTNRLDTIRPPGPVRQGLRRLLGPLATRIGFGPPGTTEPAKARTWAFPYQLFQWATLFLARRKEGGALRGWTPVPIATDGGARIWDVPSRDEDDALRGFAIPADLIATRRGHIYRSTYILIFGLVSAATGACLFSLFAAPESKWAFVIAELAMLTLVIILYATASRLEWHARWINARHVAESLRGIRLMVWSGFQGRRPLDDKKPWSAWFANAVAANCAPGHRRITAGGIAAIAGDIATIVKDQHDYHVLNHERLERFHKRLEFFGVVWVGVAIGVALIFLGAYAAWHEDPARHDCIMGLKVIATVTGGFLPAVTAALAGIRYHGDFERFAGRSQETAKQLDHIKNRIQNLQDEALKCGDICQGGPPLYEDLLDISLATQAIFEDDLHDWRFVYAARPTPGL